MGRSIVKQPDGKFAIFSSIVDNFVLTDATKEQLIEELVQEAKEDITEQINATMERIETGKRVFQSWNVLEYDDAMERINFIHHGGSVK